MQIESKEISTVYGIRSPWEITEITADHEKKEVYLHVRCTDESELCCPKCGKICPEYDRRKRNWRHLDTGSYITRVVSRIHRVKCPDCGIRTTTVPWSSPSARVTHEFDALAIDLLLEMKTVSAVSRHLGVSWPVIDGIMQRAVKRGLERRAETLPDKICVDEVSAGKGQNYVTIVSNSRTGTVIHVGEGRTKKTLKDWYHQFTPEQLGKIKSISMDMWPAYIHSSLECVLGAIKKICFDRFHIMKYISGAVDKVRRQEHKELRKEGRDDLKGTKYHWLTNKQNLSPTKKRELQLLRKSSLRTARAWAIKEMSRGLWNYVSRTWAKKGWDRWLSWAMRCRLEPMKQAGKTVKEHLWGIINAIVLEGSNGPAESINSRIKTVKVCSRGFRNKKRLATAIYFHLGGLDLYPDGVQKRAVSLK